MAIDGVSGSAVAAETVRITQAQRNRLRQMAWRYLEIANDPVNLQRRQDWLACHGLKMRRPMILCEYSGVHDANPPYDRTVHEPVQGSDAVNLLQRQLAEKIWRFETLQDDAVVEPWIDLPWQLTWGDYGVSEKIHQCEQKDVMGAYNWEPAIDMDRFEEGFAKLHPKIFTAERALTLAMKQEMEEIVGDIVPVRIRGGFFWTLGMTSTLIRWIGMEEMMLAMYDAPDELHRLMRFLCDDHMQRCVELERQGLFCLNNENDYVGSGTQGYAPDLSRASWKEGDAVTRKDLWCLIESQETVGVGSAQFSEFVFPYQKELADTFGLSYYGCCEPVHDKMPVLKTLSNLRSVSVSPWCDENISAEQLGASYVYSRKPNPTLISTQDFNEKAICEDLDRTLKIAGSGGCNFEFIMKDVHTLNNEPWRITRWVELARERIRAAGFDD